MYGQSEPLLRKACDRCTKVKAACDGGKPSCARCQRIGATDCVYSVAQKRGRKTADEQAESEKPSPEAKPLSGAALSTASTPRAAGSTSTEGSSRGGGSRGQRGSVRGVGEGASSHGSHGGYTQYDAGGAPLPGSASHFLPQPNAPFVPTPAELSYAASFFASSRELGALVDREAFEANLSKAAAGVLAGTNHASSEVGGSGSSVSSVQTSSTAGERIAEESEAVGFLMLFDVVVGLGASIQRQKQDARVYLHRAVVRMSACMMHPSEQGILAFNLLSIAVLWTYGASNPARAIIIASMESMVRILADIGRPCNGFLATVILLSHGTMTQRAGVRFCAPLPPPALLDGMPMFVQATQAGMVPPRPTPTRETPASGFPLVLLVSTEGLYGLQGRPLAPGETFTQVARTFARCSDLLVATTQWTKTMSDMMRQAGAYAGGKLPLIPDGFTRGPLSSLHVSRVMGRVLARDPIDISVIHDCAVAVQTIKEEGNKVAEIGRLLDVIWKTGLEATVALVQPAHRLSFLRLLQEVGAGTASMGPGRSSMPGPLEIMAHVADTASAEEYMPQEEDDGEVEQQGGRFKRHRSSGESSGGGRGKFHTTASSYSLPPPRPVVSSFFTEMEFGRAWAHAVEEGLAAWAQLEPRVLSMIHALEQADRSASPAASDAQVHTTASRSQGSGAGAGAGKPASMHMRAAHLSQGERNGSPWLGGRMPTSLSSGMLSSTLFSGPTLAAPLLSGPAGIYCAPGMAVDMSQPSLTQTEQQHEGEAGAHGPFGFGIGMASEGLDMPDFLAGW